MLVRTKFVSALALAACAALAGCTLYADDGSSTGASTPTDPGDTSACVHATIADCYASQLTADECADLVITRCNLDGPPTDPGDPGCHDQVLEDCLTAGGDPMSCELRASQACDPTVPPNPGDCFDQVFRDCVDQGGDPMSCQALADQTCGGTGCPSYDPNCTPGCQPGDPSCDPGCPPDDPRCGDPGCDPSDPMCTPGCPSYDPQCTPGCDPADPMCNPGCPPGDPSCGSGPNDPTCHDAFMQDCLAAGIDPMSCEARASVICANGGSYP
ncbi:MAG: hypothetical protein R3B06_27275 [Kofleriaceae bacterium]